MRAARVRSLGIVAAALLPFLPSYTHLAVHAATNPPLVIDIQYEPGTLDPQINYDTAAATVLGNVYQGLIRGVGAKSVKIVPDLATSWKQSSDGKTWTFTLRSGVKFHDGNPVDAAAVKFSFDRLFKLNQGAVGDFTEVTSIDAPNPSTVIFHLNAPFSAFLSSLTSIWGTGIVSPKTVLAHQVKSDLGQAWLADHDAGSGPWMINQWARGSKVVLDPFPGYYKGWSGTHVGEVVLQWPAASSTQRLGLEHGDVDIAINLSAQDFDQVAKESGFSVQEYTGQTIRDIRLNTCQGPLANKLVRQALSYSFDYDTMVKAVFRGHGARMLGVGPTGLANFVPAKHLYTYDLAMAKSLLAKAGYAKGFTMQVGWQEGDNQSALMAQVWKADIASLGISMNLSVLKNATYNKLIAKCSTDPNIWFGQWTMDYADDQQEYYNYFFSKSTPSSGNVFYYKNASVDSLLLQARSATDPAAAKSLFTKMLDIVYSDAPEIWAAQPNDRIALSNKVHGFVYNFLASAFYYDLYALSKS